MKKRSKWKIVKTLWFSLGIIFMVWNWMTFQARSLPGDTFQSNEKVQVIEEEHQISFKTQVSETPLEVIFFQGGLADPEAYAPLCKTLAENGFTCHLIKMAWRMPQKDYRKIHDLFDLKSGQYVIGGHSQGGKMSAQFVYENPYTMKGLFLLGTSHPRDIDLSHMAIPTLKLYAEFDGLASTPEVLENKAKLPQGTELTLIKGGNHSQFGYLGKLFTDDAAEISVEEQQEQITKHLVVFLRGLSEEV